jgi:hypothetical protein
LLAYKQKWKSLPEVASCIHNLAYTYFKDGKMIDPCISNTINWARVLIWLMNYCDSNHSTSSHKPSSGICDDRLLCETFQSIGGTCLQGATHRIFILAKAIENSK